MNLDVIGAHTQSRFVVRNGLGVLLLTRECVAQVIERIFVARIDLQGHAIVLHRFRRLAGGRLVKAKIIVSQVIVFRDLDGMGKEGFAVAPVLYLTER